MTHKQTRKERHAEALKEVNAVWAIRKELVSRGKSSLAASRIAVRAYSMGYRAEAKS